MNAHLSLLIVAAEGTTAPSLLERLGSWIVSAEHVTSFAITGFTALILGVFLLAVLLLIVPVVVRAGSLRRQATVLRRVIKSSHIDLASERPEVEKRLLRARWSQPMWQAFLKTWRELYDKSLSGAVRPIRMLEFFPPDRVIPGIANRRLAAVMPGMLVGLGILGTFLGLTLGLPALERDIARAPDESSAMVTEVRPEGSSERRLEPDAPVETATRADSNDGETLRRGDSAIKRLISGLKLAFLTSLFGIAGSLLFMFGDRVAIHALEQAVRRTSYFAEQLFPFVPEPVAAANTQRTQEQIHANLQTLGTDIATALSNSMGDAVGAAMGKYITPSIEKLEGVIAKLATVVSTDMSSVLERFNQNLSQSIEQRFGNFADSLTRMAESQESLHHNVAGFSEQLRLQTATQQQLAEQINAAASSLHGVLDGLGRITNQLDRAATRISGTSEALTSSVNTALASQQELIRVQEKLSQDLRQDLESLEESRTEIIDAWKAVSDEARGSIEVVQQSVRQLGEVVGDNLVKALDTFDTKLAEVIERFSGTLIETRETVNELPQLVRGLGQNAEKLAAAFEEVRRRFEAVTSDISASVAESSSNTREAVDKLAGVVQEATDVAGRFAAAVGAAREFWERQGGQKALEDRMIELVALSKASHDELVAARSGISALLEIKESLVGARQIVQQLHDRTITALDGSLDEAVARLKDLEVLKRSATSIAEGLDEVAPTMKQVLERLKESSEGGRFKGWFGRK